MIEEYLIGHCSPTLASLKTANLMNIPFDSIENLENSVFQTNEKLKNKGVELLILKKCSNTALVYAYRKDKLQNDLNKNKVDEFLKFYGYESNDADYCISKLKSRLKNSASFPHEIGIFLGYPLCDVIGFIENAGQNSICSGCWKVYCNEYEAIKTFKKFEKCKKIYQKLWLQGRSIVKLTVTT